MLRHSVGVRLCPLYRTFHKSAANDLLTKLIEDKDRLVLKENEALKVVGSFGVGVLQHHVHWMGDKLDGLSTRVPSVSVVKGILRHADGTPVTHKTEYKAVELGVPSTKAEDMVNTFKKRFETSGLVLEGLLFRQFVDYAPNTFGSELLISAYQDPHFGPCVVVGFGGVMVESFRQELKVPPVVIPVEYGVDYFLPILKNSFLVKTITGQLRGSEKRIEWEVLEAAVRSFAEGIKHFSVFNPDAKLIIEEIEVNPAAMESNKLLALDSVLTVRKVTEDDRREIQIKPLHKISGMLQPKTIGLVGCSEKVSSKSRGEVAASQLFRRFANTPTAEGLIARGLDRLVDGTVKRMSKPLSDKNDAKPKPKAESSSLKKKALALFQRVAFQHQLNPCNYVLQNASETNAKVIPIHPRASSILGVPCVKSVEEMVAANGGQPVDCMIVSVPASEAVNVLDKAIQLNATKSVQLFSAGFGETEVGQHLQKRLENSLKQLSGENRPLINGPNTVGNWVSGPKSFNTIFVEHPNSLMGKPTNLNQRPSVALVCQSGGFAVARLSTLGVSLHPSLAISIGNQMDLNVCDFLQNLLDNGPPEGTPFPVALGVYLEGLPSHNNGIRLMNLIARGRREKGLTVVVYKAGRTAAGMAAVASHTASMASDYATFERLLSVAGAVVAPTLEDFNLLVATAGHLGGKLKDLIMNKDKPDVLGVSGVTNSGFLKCAMADSLPTDDPAIKTKVRPSSLSSESRAKIEKIFQRHKLTEVVEVGELLDVTPTMHAEGWIDTMTVLLQDSNPHLYIFAPVTTPNATPNPSVVSYMFKGLAKQFPHKAIIASLESGNLYAQTRIKIWQLGVPCFECADTATRIVGTLLRAWLRP